MFTAQSKNIYDIIYYMRMCRRYVPWMEGCRIDCLRYTLSLLPQFLYSLFHSFFLSLSLSPTHTYTLFLLFSLRIFPAKRPHISESVSISLRCREIHLITFNIAADFVCPMSLPEPGHNFIMLPIFAMNSS